ncbi:hypothetical protein [Acetobacter oeni]|nr:hypothetical protein [Acetobacter oeni]
MTRNFIQTSGTTVSRKLKYRNLKTSGRYIAASLAIACLVSFSPAAGTTSIFTVPEIAGSVVVSGTGESLTDMASAIQQNTNTLTSESSTLSQIYSMALTALQTSELGLPDGPAELDDSGNLTDPVATTVATVSDYATIGWNAAQTFTTDQGTKTQLASPPIAFNDRWLMDNSEPDDYMPPTHLRLGGSQQFDNVPLFVHNIPYGEGNMGIVEGVYMQSENMRGSIAGVGVGDANGIATYDNFDAVARYTYAGPSSPIFVTTGTAVTAPDGLAHIPTFTTWGATFSNPLPLAWTNWIISHNHTRMMTNELGLSSGSIRTYAGVLTGYDTNSDGLITEIYTDGWRLFLQSAATTNQIPGTTTADDSTPGIDTVWSNFTDPAIMFGVYTKEFGNNVICDLPGPTPNVTPGDVNDPTANANNQSRSCEGIEYDLWDDDQTNNTAYMHGITVAYSGRSNPTLESYDMLLAGGNANMLELDGEWYSMNIGSRAFSSGSYGGPAYAAGSQKIVAEFDQSNTPGTTADDRSASHDMRMTIWNTRNSDDTSNTTDFADFTTSLGVQVDGHEDITALTMDGTVQEHIEFNPAAYPNGIALCGQTGCGLAVDIAGNPKLYRDTNILSGKALYFNDANDVVRGYLWGGSDGNMHIVAMPGESTEIEVDASLHVNGAVNATSDSYSGLPASGSSTGDQLYCTDCYSSAGSSSHKGIPVWWNGSAWTDALGVTAEH